MTGVLMKLKMGAGLTGLRNIFDRLNQSQMYVGEIMSDLMLNNFGIGKIKNIIGEQPTEILQNVITPENQLLKMANTMLKYNCAVEEGELTSSQRQLKFLQLVQMKQIIPDSIDDSDLLNASTIQGKSELVEKAKAKSENMQKMQEAQAQQAMQQQQMLNRSLEAKAQADFAGAEEKKATAVQKIALAKQETSQAVHQRAAAALDNAKALKEIDHMDDDKLIKLANFIIDMQMKQRQMQGGEEGDATLQAKNIGSSVERVESETNPNAQASSLTH